MDLAGVEDCVRKIASWVHAPDSESRCLLATRPDDPMASKNDVYHVLSVMENLGTKYNRGFVDREWVERMIGPVAVNMFASCLWFIAFVRELERWPRSPWSGR